MPDSPGAGGRAGAGLAAGRRGAQGLAPRRGPAPPRARLPHPHRPRRPRPRRQPAADRGRPPQRPRDRPDDRAEVRAGDPGDRGAGASAYGCPGSKARVWAKIELRSPASRTPACRSRRFTSRDVLVDVFVAELAVADLVDPVPHRLGFVRPVGRGRALPGLELLQRGVVDEGGELGEAQASRCRSSRSPRPSGGCVSSLNRHHLDGVAAAVGAPSDMQGLVDVAHEMNEEPQGLLLRRPGRLRVAQHGREPLDRLEHVPGGIARGRLQGLAVVDADEVPGSRPVSRRDRSGSRPARCSPGPAPRGRSGT